MAVPRPKPITFFGPFFSAFAAIGLTACGLPDVELAENAVVSLSLCADSYLHALPEIEPRLTALSWQSRSTLSVTPDHLKSLPQADTDLERALIWSGATRISSAGGSGEIDLEWGEDFNTVWENLDRLSIALKTTNPTANFKARLNALPEPASRPRILYLDRSGASAGPGTFVDAVIRAAGADNIIQTPGWQSPDTESLIQFEPDIIVTSFMSSTYTGVNDRSVLHGALVTKIASIPQIDIPGKLWPCAGPGLVTAAETLSKAMAEL